MKPEPIRLGRVRYKGRNAWLVALLRALLELGRVGLARLGHDPYGMARGVSLPARYRGYRDHLREYHGA